MKKIFFIVSILSLFLVSCNNSGDDQDLLNNQQQSTDILNAFSSLLLADIPPLAGDIWLIDKGTNKSKYFTALASFVSKPVTSPLTTNGVDAGTLQIGSFTTQGKASNGDHDYSFTNKDNYKDNFGKNLTISLSGNPNNDVPTFSADMYVPQSIEMSVEGLPASGREISISAENVISWNIDPQNTHGVAVAIAYEKVFTHHESSIYETLPEESVLNYELVEDTQGTYVLSAKDFANIPVGGLIRIMVTRVNGKIVEIPHKENTLKYRLATYTYDSYYLRVVE